MYSNAVILRVDVRNIGYTKGGAPISIVLASDSVGRANKHRLHLRLDTHEFNVTQ